MDFDILCKDVLSKFIESYGTLACHSDNKPRMADWGSEGTVEYEVDLEDESQYFSLVVLIWDHPQ